VTSMDDALAYIDSLQPGVQWSYSKIAAQFGVERTTLARRHQGKSASRKDYINNASKLSQQQEDHLVKYIQDLTARRLPPTRSMIKNFAQLVVGGPVSERTISRFLAKNHQRLLSKWSVCMASNRHKADSVLKYTLYFELLQKK
ncbi:hypothetical protein DM02DRAFT_483149, partial [Periconia macrospinosa]